MLRRYPEEVYGKPNWKSKGIQRGIPGPVIPGQAAPTERIAVMLVVLDHIEPTSIIINPLRVTIRIGRDAILRILRIRTEVLAPDLEWEDTSIRVPDHSLFGRRAWKNRIIVGKDPDGKRDFGSVHDRDGACLEARRGWRPLYGPKPEIRTVRKIDL